MDFAANAVLDQQPPLRTPSAARADASSSDQDAPFADHLDMALDEEDALSSAQARQRGLKEAPSETTETESAIVVTPVVTQQPDQAWSLTLATSKAETRTADAVTTQPAQPAATPAIPQAAATGAAAQQNQPASGQTATLQPTSEGTLANASRTQEASIAPIDVPIASTPTQSSPTPQVATTAPIVIAQSIAANVAVPSLTQFKAQDSKVEAKPLGAPTNAQPKADVEKPQPQPPASAFRAAPNAVQAAVDSSKPANLAADNIETPNTTQQTPTQVTQAATQAAASLEQIASTHAQARAVPAAAQVAREIVRRFDGETTQFELRLDPPELGRVEVRLEVTRDHRVTAVVAADNPQALAELARHARELEQMLQSAGLQLGENGLAFDLRQGGERSQEARDGEGDSGVLSNGEAEATSSQMPQLARPIGYERWRGVRVDISV